MQGINLFFLLLLVTNFQSSVPANTGSNVTHKEAQIALDYHNKARSEVNSPPLEWSIELSAYAQEWANRLAIEGKGEIRHRPEKRNKGKKYGENIFYGSGYPFSSLDASETWCDEINYYAYDVISPNKNKGTGHYTQMVWKTTKSVGIGIARFGKEEVIIVANYDPPGNIIGKKPY